MDQIEFYHAKLKYETDSWDLYNASTKGALNMAKLGFQVKELMGGLDWWKRDGYETKGKQGVQGTEVVCGC